MYEYLHEIETGLHALPIFDISESAAWFKYFSMSAPFSAKNSHPRRIQILFVTRHRTRFRRSHIFAVTVAA
jgi:hypothetical protein